MRKSVQASAYITMTNLCGSRFAGQFCGKSGNGIFAEFGCELARIKASDHRESMFADAAQLTSPIELPMAEFIFGSTAGMKEARERLEAALQDDAPVLIEGESGTGKELVARYLHLRSRRANGPFVRVNCGAIAARLPDREMIVKGWSSPGDQVAEGICGTVFLDEFAEVDEALRQEIFRELKSARAVCASSVGLKGKHPEGMTCSKPAGEFKHRVRLLPLRERKRDLPALCEYLVEKCARNFGRSMPRLSATVLEEFERWHWPGNVRELENWIARIVIFGSEDTVGLDFRRHVETREAWDARRRHCFRVNLSRYRGIWRHG